MLDARLTLGTQQCARGVLSASFEYFARWWARLEVVGLQAIWTEPNLVYVNIVCGVRPELAEVGHFVPSPRLYVTARSNTIGPLQPFSYQ